MRKLGAQEFRLYPGLTVRENIMLGASNRGRIAKRELLAESDQMFDLFPDKMNFAHKMS